MLAVAILAAGESRRMGVPKALLPYRGGTFVDHLLAVTRHPRVGVTRLVLGAGAADIRKKLTVDSSDIVVNSEWEKGQLSSIHAAIRSLQGEATEGLILCPVDHPLVSAQLIAQLIEQFDSSGRLIVLPTFRGRRGHPVIFRSSLYNEIMDALSDTGARQVVWAHPEQVLEVATEEEGITLNLNDPAALKRALQDSA
jgi:molybdenum cofactor cytidylyltransferase